MKNLLLNLSYSLENELEDVYEQFRAISFQKALETAQGDGSESSMGIRQVGLDLEKIFGSNPQHRRMELGQVHTLDSLNFDVKSKRAMFKFAEEFNPVSVYHHMRSHLGERFWQLNDEGDDEGMYTFLQGLGFEGSREELDEKYRVNGKVENRWQYAFFQQDLPVKLVPLLFAKEIFCHKNLENSNLFLRYSHGSVEVPMILNQTYYDSNTSNDSERMGFSTDSNLPRVQATARS